MKKFLIIASFVAFALAGCNKAASNVAGAAAADSTGAYAASGQVAYVNLDSLIGNYTMYTDLRKEFESKAEKANNDLMSRGRSLERDVMDFQNKVQKGLVTTATAQQMQADLEKRNESFQQYRQSLGSQMAEEEQVFLNNIHFSIVEYLKEFNADLRYGMIISTSSAGPILNADPALDITTVVLKGLNEKYNADKAAKKTPKAE